MKMLLDKMNWQVRTWHSHGSGGWEISPDGDREKEWRVVPGRRVYTIDIHERLTPWKADEIAADFLPCALACGCPHIVVHSPGMVRTYVAERLPSGDVRCRPVATEAAPFPLAREQCAS